MDEFIESSEASDRPRAAGMPVFAGTSAVCGINSSRAFVACVLSAGLFSLHETAPSPAARQANTTVCFIR